MIWGPRNKDWKKQEKSLEKEGAKRTPGSGNGIVKGDAQGKTFKIECKYTVNNDYRLTTRVVDKIEKEAMAIDVLPLLQIKVKGEHCFAIIRKVDVESFAKDANILEKLTFNTSKPEALSFVISTNTVPSIAAYGFMFTKLDFNGYIWYAIAWDRFKEFLNRCGVFL